MINCLIIEDEVPAQKVLLNYIENTPYLSCIGVYESGLQASIEQVMSSDLIFLDIQLPMINGLDFMKTIDHAPPVIITTAFADYTLAAFEHAAIDYLLKPFSYERFIKAVSRIRNRKASIIKEDGKDYSFVYADRTYHKVELDSIFFIKSEIDYINLHLENKKLLIHDSLNNWEKKGKKNSLIRVHRSYIVNLSKIDKVKDNQIYILDQIIPIGKKYKDYFMQLIKTQC